MPSRKLSIGSAIASGADSFLKSYMFMEGMKQKEKLQENAFIIQTLMGQLEDETLSLRRRAKILDSIPKLVGIKKMDRKLSEMLGLDDEFLDQPQEPVIKGKEGIPEQDFVDTNIVDPSIASSIRLKGTQSTPDIPASSEKVGELTPLLIKKKLLLETRKAEDEQDINKQTKLLKINYDLQMKSLKATGFTKEIFRGYDRNGNYIVTMANQNGERKDIFLGDVDPDSIVKAQISANKPSKFLQERERYWLNQINPDTGMNYSEDEANLKALEDANKQFQLKQRTGEAYVKSVEQGITGTKPIQPSQSIDDNRAVAERKSILRANLNSIKRQAQDASNDAANKSKQANDHWINVVEPIKKEITNLLQGRSLEDLDESEMRNFSTQQARLNTEINRYNDLKRAADDADSRDKALKNSVIESEEILNQYEKEVGNITTIPDNIKKAIKHIRDNNLTQTRTMSDDDIIRYLKDKGKIK